MTSPLNTSTQTALVRIMHPGSVIYSQGFEAFTADSWAAGTGATSAPTTGNPQTGLFYTHSGVCVLSVTITTGTRAVSRTLTGLTVGRTYTFSGWVRSSGTPLPTASVGVTGIGSGLTTTLASGAWVALSYTFVATATSHVIVLTMTTSYAFGWTFSWDDLLLFEHDYQTDSVTLTGVKSARPKLDERHAPYANASITAAIPSLSDLAKIDPRTTNIRVTLSAGNVLLAPSSATQTRDFDLVLHERSVNFKTAEITLVLEGDESLLIDAGNKTGTADTSAEANQTSLRGIVTAFLAKYYAGLEPGSADADLTVTYNATNRINNPSFETNAAGVPASTGTSATARIANPGSPAYLGSGSWCLRATASASNSFVGFAPITGTFSATAGQTYTFSFWLQSSVSRVTAARINWYDSSGAVIGFTDGTASASPLTSATFWTRYFVTAVAPAGTTSLQPFVFTTGNAVGNLHYIDGVMLTDGPDLVSTFDGSFTDTYYTYAWVGTAHASPSTRTKLDTRDRYLLQQPPGTKDWDFIQRIVQAAGLRLFCDEARVWRLVNPTTYTVAGTIDVASGINLTGGTDTISKQDGTWYDAVVIKYSWIGADGLAKVSYDAASTGAGTTLLPLEWDLAYPGPGGAAAVLARAHGRGRVQSPEALTDLTATPGMALTTELDSTPNQAGVISAVEWSWAASGDVSDTMTITARDLADA